MVSGKRLSARNGESLGQLDHGFTGSALKFLADFIDFSGNAGARAVFWVLLGAILDGAGLLLLVPVIGIVIAEPAGRGAQLVVRLLHGAGIDAPSARLGALLCCFALLVAFRIAVQWRRDMALAWLRVGFVEARRCALVARIANAPWERLHAIDHARVNNLVGSDIPLMGGSIFFLLQGGVALCTLVFQWFLALLLSPILATAAAGFALVSAAALLPHLAQSRALGREAMETNLELAARGSHFFSGLKLAVSQNLQRRFADEFSATIRSLLQRQVDFLRQQSRARIVFTALSAFAAAGAIFLGIAFSISHRLASLSLSCVWPA